MSTTFFFIAGEPSGDALGASLISALKHSEPDIVLDGIGGDLMASAGLKSLIPMDELCVIGLWEVLSQITRLNRLIIGVVEEIEKRQPDVVVTIDLPDFNFRVAQKLKQRGTFKGKIVHYVAPTVWAWRPGRAKKVAAFLDGIMCLYPFEPEYFTKHGLAAHFVGHPLADQSLKDIDTDDICEEHDIPKDVIKIGVFLGSRQHEIDVISPVLIDAIGALQEQYKDKVCLVFPTLPHMDRDIVNIASDFDCPAYVLSDQKKKFSVFSVCDYAVAVSGTVGLELSYLGIPHIIAYKVHPLTYLALKILVKTKYAHLGNILLDKPVVPEFLQLQCTPVKIAKALYELIHKPELVQEQKAEMAALSAMIKPKEGGLSADSAAEFLLKFKKAG
jgi:lipid-A-disaccharide synthase